MELYLVQHGKAQDKEKDPERPLTEGGRAESAKVAKFVAEKAGMNVTGIYHSGKLRASQTAELLGEFFRPDNVEPAEGLKAKDDPSIWADQLKDRTDGVVLVGHLPHLDKLSSLLLAGDPDKSVIEFRNGGMVALGRDDDGNWKVRWVVTPELAV